MVAWSVQIDLIAWSVQIDMTARSVQIGVVASSVQIDMVAWSASPRCLSVRVQQKPGLQFRGRRNDGRLCREPKVMKVPHL